MDTSDIKGMHMAKIYLFEAQRTQWRDWKFFLLNTVAKHRKIALEKLRQKREKKPGQMELFQ